MSIIVTATSGNLGSSIVRALLNRGADPTSVIATARDSRRLTALSSSGVRVADLDYNAPQALSAIASNGDVLVLVSGSEMGQRVAQHTGMIDAAIAAGVTRIAYTSALRATTSALLVNPEHKATEEHLTASGVAFTALRNGWYNENYRLVLDEARRDGGFFGSVGRGRVTSAAIADYADAAAVVALDDAYAGRVLELGGDEAWSYPELAQKLSEVLGTPVTYTDLTPEAHQQRLESAGVPSGRAAFAVALDGNTRDGLLSDDSGDLCATIGRPTTPIAHTLAAMAQQGTGQA